ncbi:MAG: transporter [Sedimentisphaerales bacterium]|nr:transporter [Sedimentisphaerales bacterium]
MKVSIKIMLSLVVSAILLSGIAFAETGHYPLGVEGIKAATLPPPGMYLRIYNSFYTANELKDSGGDDSVVGLDLDAFAFVPRFIWITEHKFLGADYGMDALIPFVATDAQVSPPGTSMSDSDFCYGDLFVEPIDLAWHEERYDIGAAFGVWMPTGKYNKATADSPLNEMVSAGKDFWTYMFTLGGTYYLDEEKTWSASILSRYEIHSRKDHTDVKPGQNILFEWGVAKTIYQFLDVGVVGYSQWQLTSDSGSDVTWDKGVHDRVSAIGPEFLLFMPSNKAFLSFRALWEYSAVDRPEGTTLTLTFTQIF